MIPEGSVLDVEAELDGLRRDLISGNPHASVHLARLIEADRRGVFGPFAQALGARFRDHVQRCCEMCRQGIAVDDLDFQDEASEILKLSAVDWDELPCTGRPGEEA